MKTTINTVAISSLVDDQFQTRYAYHIEDDATEETHILTDREDFEIDPMKVMDTLITIKGLHILEGSALNYLWDNESCVLVNGELLEWEQIRPLFETTKSLLPLKPLNLCNFPRCLHCSSVPQWQCRCLLFTDAFGILLIKFSN